tara:strand:+ start:29530 stop:29922 length:393 start_codon:yes stop_codon:yes gene_type:complete
MSCTIRPKYHKQPFISATVELLALIQSVSVSLCGIAILLWMSIGTFARTERGEKVTQKLIAVICVTSAILLFILHYMGGELWGSRNVARPFALAALLVAFAGMMNIKGKDVQGEINPHEIMKMRKNSDDD